MPTTPALYRSEHAVGETLLSPDRAAPFLTVCINNDVETLKHMLGEVEFVTIALESPQRIYHETDSGTREGHRERMVFSMPTLNLAFMLETAAAHAHPMVVAVLLAFGAKSEISRE